MQFQVTNRFTGETQFTAEIDCTDDAPTSDKLGLAVKWAIKTKANLAGADLAGAKGLTDDQLRHVKADLWMILSMARHEVPALIHALRDGKVDGSTYKGECACLVGTLENAGAENLPHVASSPAETWFTAIRKGNKPGDDSTGGFASQKALEWTLEYCRVTGLEVEAA